MLPSDWPGEGTLPGFPDDVIRGEFLARVFVAFSANPPLKGDCGLAIRPQFGSLRLSQPVLGVLWVELAIFHLSRLRLAAASRSDVIAAGGFPREDFPASL